MVRNCPRCNSGLVDREFGSLTLDGCTSCGGIWFDREELGKLTRDPGTGVMEVERAFQPAVSGTEMTGKMNCPDCTVPLYAFSFPHTPDVELDACRQCRGIWADEGELQKIAQRIEASRAVTQPLSPAALNAVDTARQQMRSVASFLITRPCSGCGQSNPSSALVCWACGQAMQMVAATPLCPRCDQTMIEFSPEQGPANIDACLNCKGVWFAGGELATFLRFGLVAVQDVRQRIGDGLGHFIDRRIGESQMLSCPRCNFCMERDTLGSGSSIHIDVCPTCKGIWLDAGELVAAYEYYQAGGIPGARSTSDPWR